VELTGAARDIRPAAAATGAQPGGTSR